MAPLSASELLSEFAIRLTQARIAAGYKTRKEMADKMEVDQNTYSPWERGRSYPNPKDLAVIRDLLKVTVDWLFYGDERHLSVECHERLKAAECTARNIFERRKSLAKAKQ